MGSPSVCRRGGERDRSPFVGCSPHVVKIKYRKVDPTGLPTRNTALFRLRRPRAEISTQGLEWSGSASFFRHPGPGPSLCSNFFQVSLVTGSGPFRYFRV